jgi:predicted PurR-regulated permease PerM
LLNCTLRRVPRGEEVDAVDGPARRPLLSTFASLAIVVAALRFASPVLLPLAAAALLSVVLTPFVRRVERLGIGRISAVLCVSLAVTGTLSGMGWILANQGGVLLERAPEYRRNVIDKLRDLRQPLHTVQQAAEQMKEIERQIDPSAKPSPAPKVQLVDGGSGLIALARDWVGSIATPIASAGLAIVMLVFILIEREDLRDRLIRVLGQRDLRLTTSAMGDATQRVTGYLRAYTLLNLGHGLVIGAGLWLFGLPGAPLFGLLSFLLRFVPYLGPWVAASLPIALSVAIFDGWSRPIAVAGFFAAVELLSNNVVEPWLYGSRVGLSPFAVIFSAVFWAWLWGPVGLVLAIPLTVCLVVLGRHVPQLESLSILLGDEPALHPAARLYQRLLARDIDEAEDLLEDEQRERGREASWDEIVLPALRLLEWDRRRGRLGDEQVAFARETLEVLAGELGEPLAGEGASVLCLPAQEGGDEIVCQALARLLGAAGVAAQASGRLLTAELAERAARDGARVVALSALEPEGGAVRYLAQRVLARCPEVEIVVGAWGEDRPGASALGTRLRGEPRVHVVGSLVEARQRLVGLAALSLQGAQPEACPEGRESADIPAA